MRRTMFRSSDEQAMDLFARSPTFDLAGTTSLGEPLLRTLHGVVVDERVVFHGAPVGEKTKLVGTRVVAQASETVVALPSYFSDEEQACPATTLYRSAQVHGTVRAVDEPRRKAVALQALMQKLQPEGGHVPIDPDHPRYDELYKKAVAKIAVWEIDPIRLDGKFKLLQHKTPKVRAEILQRLWQRGAPGDERAMEVILEESAPEERPAFLRGPGDATMHLAPTRADAELVAALCAPTYWNTEFTVQQLVDAHLASAAWIVARSGEGELVASARAVSDLRKRAWVYDVVVTEAWQRKGLGDAVMRLLLEHPAVRQTRVVHLGTRDAMGFYRRLGFLERESLARPYHSVEMVLRRP